MKMNDFMMFILINFHHLLINLTTFIFEDTIYRKKVILEEIYFFLCILLIHLYLYWKEFII